MKKDIFVDYDFQKVGQIIGGKFELNSMSELSALEAAISALTPDEIQATKGLSVTVAPDNTGFKNAIYTYNPTTLRFQGEEAFRGFDIETLAFNFDALDPRVGEKFLYTGPAGIPTFTQTDKAVIVIGQQELIGAGASGSSSNEYIQVYYEDSTALVLLVQPLTRADAGGGVVSFFATIDLAGLGASTTVTHNLGLVDKDAFSVRVADATGSEVEVDVDSVDVNSITLTSLVPAAGVKVFINGQAA